MFGTLLESKRSHQWRLAGTAASVVVHTAVIAVAMVTGASATTRLPVRDRLPDSGLVWIAPPERVAPAHLSHGTAPRAHVLVDRVTLPTGRIVYADGRFNVPVIQEPDLVVDLSTDGYPTGCGGDCEKSGGDPSAPAGTVATVATVDRAALLVAQPRPRYPEPLRAAGVTGRVLARFVVDTLGRVERASIVIRESSHDLFVEAVRATLPALTFVPAEAGGRKVRMLVDLPFEFRLKD